MTAWNDFGNIWTTFKELDIRPIAEEAEHPLVLAFIGSAGCGKSTLIAALRHDKRARDKVITPTIEADLNPVSQLGAADALVLVLDGTQTDFAREANLFAEWKNAGQRIVVLYNKMDAVQDVSHIGATMPLWSGARIAFGSALDPDSLKTDFIPRVMETLKGQEIALARHYPLFRISVARQLINDTAFANATYSIGTGLAEIVPMLDIPFNVADMVVLTKNQALMVYKLGLMLGLSTRWQDHATELGGVVGASFLWRQVARQLIGLVPVWGILPKVAVAYAGTYAIGEAILYWYQTGHKVSGRGMRDLYTDALAHGKQVAQELITHAPKLSMPQVSFPALPQPRARVKLACPNCGKQNPSDAKFCAYCATALHQDAGE